MVGRTMYETLIKGYTEKQWGRKATELPPFIIERLPLRFTFDNNYFNDPYQGVPMAGYSPWVDKMLEGTEVRLNTDFLADKDYWMKKAGHVLYTGAIDAFFDYRLGALEYRSLTFEHVLFEQPNVQGIAVINETDSRIPYTRSIEHKHFAFGTQPASIVTHEFLLLLNVGLSLVLRLRLRLLTEIDDVVGSVALYHVIRSIALLMLCLPKIH